MAEYKWNLAIEYFNQKQNDKKYGKVVSAIMELACGLGMQDRKKSREIISQALETLRSLVGNQEAENIVSALETMHELLASKQYAMPHILQPRKNVLNRTDTLNFSS